MNLESKIIPFHLHPLGFIECFVNFGAQLDALLANTDISYRMIDSGDGAISYRQQDALITNGLRLCGRENLGLRVGSTMDWSYHGTVGSVVFCSSQLKDAWNVFFRFLRTTQPECAHRIFEQSFYINKQRHVVEPISGFGHRYKTAEIAQFELEFMLAIGLRICMMCGNKSAKHAGISLKLSYPKPKDLSAYRALPCDEIQFSQAQTAISAHLDFVSKPWRPFRKHTFDKLVSACEQELESSDLNISTSSRTRWLIGTSYFDKPLALEDIAEKLNMTPRTLTRRLAKENTSFRTIFYQVRMGFTVYHLQNSDLVPEELATLMRFSSVASLRRAVKNYSGSTLASLRRKPLQKPQNESHNQHETRHKLTSSHPKNTASTNKVNRASTAERFGAAASIYPH